ncbi:MAG: serpin family protein [Acidimicrobiia bacterium]|nr:serpin family protein [Acidimicrobiia bacterium]
MERLTALDRRSFVAMGSAALVGLLLGCGTDDGPSAGNGARNSGDLVNGESGDVLLADVDRLPGDAGAGADVVAATNRFGADLWPLVAEDGENLAYSPLSIAIALAMTSAGARGSTLAEFEQALGAEDTAAQEGWAWTEQQLSGRAGDVTLVDGSGGEVSLHIANRLFAQAGFDIDADFVEVVSAAYGAGVGLEDFAADPDGARERINAWVADQTEDQIPDLLPDGAIDTLTRLVLANAVYFKAPWLSPFEEAATADRPFTLADGTTVDVPTMSNTAGYGNASGPGWEAVTLPYGGEELEMVIVLPDEDAFAEVEAQVPDGLFDEVPSGELDRLQLTLPRFQIRSPLPLREPLEALGLEAAFDPDRADFSGINPAPDFYIQDVVHEAFVAVDEEGTEAAAATGVIMGITSMPPSVVVDRPFLWAIRDVPTGLVLFLGRVLDPS